jgi:hypothetical protein
MSILTLVGLILGCADTLFETSDICKGCGCGAIARSTSLGEKDVRASSGFHVGGLGRDANRLAGSFLAAAPLVFRSPFQVALRVAILLTGGRPVSCGQHDTRHGARGFPWFRLRSVSGDTDARLGAQLAYDRPRWVKGAKRRKRHNDARITRIGGDLRASSLDGPRSGLRQVSGRIDTSHDCRVILD